jgi:hypothetical protein
VSEERQRRQQAERELERLRAAHEASERELTRTRVRIATGTAAAGEAAQAEAVRVEGAGQLLCQFEGKGPWRPVAALASDDGILALRVDAPAHGEDGGGHNLCFFPLKWSHSDHGALPDGGVCRGCAKRKYTKYCTQCFLCAGCAGLRVDADCESTWTAVSEWAIGCTHSVSTAALSAETVEHPFAVCVELAVPDSWGWQSYRLDARTPGLREAWQQRLRLLMECPRRVERPLFLQYGGMGVLGRTSSGGSSSGSGRHGSGSLRSSGTGDLVSVPSESTVVSSEFNTPRSEPSEAELTAAATEQADEEEGEPPEPLSPTLSNASSGSEEFEMARGVSALQRSSLSSSFSSSSPSSAGGNGNRAATARTAAAALLGVVEVRKRVFCAVLY